MKALWSICISVVFLQLMSWICYVLPHSGDKSEIKDDSSVLSAVEADKQVLEAVWKDIYSWLFMYCLRKLTLSLTKRYSGCSSMLQRCFERSLSISGLKYYSLMLFIIIMEVTAMAGNLIFRFQLWSFSKFYSPLLALSWKDQQLLLLVWLIFVPKMKKLKKKLELNK